MRYKDIRISHKLAVSFALLIAMFAGVSISVQSGVAEMDDASRIAGDTFRMSMTAQDIQSSTVEQVNAVRGFTFSAKPLFLETYAKSRETLRASADKFRSDTQVEEQKRRIDAYLGLARDLEVRLNRIVELARNPGMRAQAQALAGEDQLSELRGLMSQILATQNARIAAKEAELAEAGSGARSALWMGGLLAALAAGGLGWLLSSTIARPVRGMTELMKRLAGGDARIEVSDTDRRDEIGDMAKAVVVFREAAVAKQAAEAAKRESDAQQQMVVDTLSNNLRDVSQGDLTADIRIDLPPAYAELKANFNDALASLRELIGSVTESASSINTGSGEIAHASEDLARRTEGNAASLEETSASLVQIDGRLKATAVAAARTVERADQAIATVGGGRAIADEAVQAMGRVSDSAKGIDSVIEGLDKIAFQTRVLAMNAAVEAGRAGDAGRGFAVVADLVSALAMRAEEEAKRARDQLTVTQTDIVTAVEAVQKVDGALADISGDVGEVHQLLGTMAADNQAQSSAITEISAAISTMDQSTQQNAAMVEETSAAARNLSSEVGALTEQAARFKVGGGERSRQAPRTKANPANPASFSGPVKPLPAAAVPALVRSGGDDWNEF